MRQTIFKSLAILIVSNLAFVFAVKAHCTNHQDSPLQQLGKKAVIVIKKKRTESLNGYLLLVCTASSWKSLEKDSELGPFLRHKKAAGNIDAIVAMPSDPKDGSTYGIYFQDNKPIGFVEIKTDQGEKITPENLAKGYVSVTEEPDRGTADQIRFEISEAYSDDNQPIPTLKVISDGPSPSAKQQEDYRSGAIKTSSGYLVVWNASPNYYILEIKGKDVRQTSTERKFFSVDGLFLQIVDAPIEDVIQAAKRQNLNDKAILEAHRDWEVKFMEGEYKAALKPESSWQKLTNGKDALLWQTNVPESVNGNVRKQIYLTVVNGQYFLTLGGVVTDTTDESAVKQLLLTTIETLKASDKPTDLQKLRDAIRKKSSGGGGV